MSGQAGSIPSPYDSPTAQTPKSTVSAESESPLKGSFMRGFGRSRTGRSTRTGESQSEASAGEGSNGMMGSSRLNVESNQKTTSAASSVSTDGSEAESLGRLDSSAGFTIPASNGSAFPDLNEPYAPSSIDLPTKRLSQLKVSSSEADRGEASADSVDGFPQSPKTPAAGSAKAKDSPSSGPGPFGTGPRSHDSSQGASTEEGMPMRRAFDLNSTDSPTASPSFAQRSRRSTRGDVIRPNGSSSNIDEPLTKFEVNLATGAGSGGSRRGRRKSDSLPEVWLTVDQIRLVTKPSSFPPPSRPPPPRPPPLGRQHSGSDRHRSSQKAGGPETPKHGGSGRSQSSEAEKQQSSPRSESSGADRVHSREKVQACVDVERQQHGGGGKQGGSGTERANGGVQKQGGSQKAGFVLPEVTVVDLGSEIKPSREERDRMRGQADRAARRAKREEERLKEKERIQREGLSGSIFNDMEAGGREPSRSRAGRDKVFYPKERHSQDPATRREEDIQYRVQRQQAKEIQERLARQEEARDRENERSGDRLRRSAEKAALEAQERAERAAVERAVQEAHERAERAARQRAAAAREKERMKEKERERERERDREEEKLRDRQRERERGLAEQLRSRESFRATSEPRQRPTVSGVTPASGLSRFSSGSHLNKFSGTAADTGARKSPAGGKASDDWTSLYTQPSPSSGAEKFQEIPGEPADRRKLRLEKQTLIEERAARALQEKNMRDQALQREQEERQRFASSLDADVRRWSVGKEGNLRALLSTLHMMLWPECNWKIVSMSDLVSGPSVKKAYQRAILCVHPDKVQQKGANVKQKYIAEKVFDLLKDAYAKFNSELY